MSRRHRLTVFASCFLFVLAGTFSANLAAPVVSSTPSSIDRFDPAAIEVSVSGLLGAELHLRMLVDLNGNGAVDAGDEPIWSGIFIDNGAAWSPTMPVDSDAASGTITLDLRLFQPLTFPYSVGDYLWQAEDFANGMTSVTAFEVTQTTELQSIAGRVTVEGTSDPVPGAMVVLLPLSEDCEESEITALTDSLGDYVIQVPDDIACSHRVVVTLKPGFVGDFGNALDFEFTGSDVFAGVDLTLAHATEAATGSLLYESGPRIGEGIPGVFMFAESEDDGIAIAFTDIDGSYTLGLANGDWTIEADNEDHLALQGAVGREQPETTFSVAGEPAAIPNILIPAANAFIRGTLFDDVGTPVGGQRVEADNTYGCGSDCFFAGTITDPGGAFVLAVAAPTGPGTADYVIEPVMPLEGLVGMRAVITLSEGDDLLGQDLVHVAPTQTIFGTFTDAEGAPVGDVCIWGETFGPEMYVSRAKVDCDGTYALPVLDGDWNVRFSEDDLLSFFRGLDRTGFQQQVTIDGEDEVLDAVLGRASFLPTLIRLDPPAAKVGDHVVIEGTNFGGNPLPLVFFDATPATIVASRPDFGRLLVEVPAGVGPGGVDVTVVNMEFGGIPANVGCFEVLAGSFSSTCSITGNLTINAGSAPYANGLVVAQDPTTEEIRRVAVSDASGDYVLDLEDSGATYDLFVISSTGILRIWGSYEGVSCPAVQDHNLRTGRLVSGRVTGMYGEGVAGVRVQAESSLSFADQLTDDQGEFRLRMDDGETVGFQFTAPIGSRYVNDQFAQVTVSGVTTVPDVQLYTGSLFAGRLLDRNGGAVSATIVSQSLYKGSFGPSGRTVSDSCTGAFTIALPTGPHGLRIPNATDQTETRVETLDIDGDELSEFDFTVFDSTAVPFTGPEPRLNDDLDPQGQVGQPVSFGVENLAEFGVSAWFAPGNVAVRGGPGIPGVDTIWDPVRGILLTRVPAGADSGDLVVDVQGSVSSPYPFTVLPGTWNQGAFTLSGTVTHSAAPVEGAVVVMFRRDPSDPSCDGDDDTIHDYAVTDAAGAFSLTHPGGDLALFFLPPRALGPAKGVVETPTDLAPLFMEFPGETGDRPRVAADLVTGEPLTLRVVAGLQPPVKEGAGIPTIPVPNALVFAEGDLFDFGLTGPDGTITFWLTPGPFGIEVAGPVGSRLVATESGGSAPGDLGDFILFPGYFLGGRLADEQGSPVFGAFAEVFANFGGGPKRGGGGGGGGGFFFEVTTRDNGVWNGPVPGGFPFSGSVGPDNETLSDARFDYFGGISGDLIRYPSDIAHPAGIIEGTVFDSLGMAPLPFTGIGTFFDEFGYPGASSGGNQTCEDGTYRMKVAEGSHFIGAFPDYYFSDLLQGWYSPSTLGDFCYNDAEPVFVIAGTTVSGADIELDTRSGISGTVSDFGSPESGINVNVTQGRLGSCRVDAYTDSFGFYNAEVPTAAGYRVESQSPPSFGGPSQCWDSEFGCTTFTPVTTTPLMTTPGIDFSFGFPPPEISEFEPPLTVANPGGGMLTLTFEMRPPQDRADFYNIYGGSLGTFGTSIESACFLDPSGFNINGDGTYSHTFVPNPGDEWFLVSASNPLDEGPLGHGRTLTNSCGALPFAVSSVEP